MPKTHNVEFRGNNECGELYCVWCKAIYKASAPLLYTREALAKWAIRIGTEFDHTYRTCEVDNHNN